LNLALILTEQTELEFSFSKQIDSAD